MQFSTRLEDEVGDILNKAATGLGLGKRHLSAESGLPLEGVNALLSGEGNADDLLRLAPVLGLHGPSLVDLAEGRVAPPQIEVAGLTGFTTPFPVPGYEEMTVNSYLVRAAGSPVAVAFDAGTDVAEMLQRNREEQLSLELILITHAHGDHVQALDLLIEGAGRPPVRVHQRESLARAEPFPSGESFRAGPLRIESRLTSGHSPGGTTYVIGGLDRPVAVVGDALFCCSQGGASRAYPEALQNNREQILSLPDETVLCPGHGPMTTVAFEKAHNPFFPEFKA